MYGIRVIQRNVLQILIIKHTYRCLDRRRNQTKMKAARCVIKKFSMTRGFRFDYEDNKVSCKESKNQNHAMSCNSASVLKYDALQAHKFPTVETWFESRIRYFGIWKNSKSIGYIALGTTLLVTAKLSFWVA